MHLTTALLECKTKITESARRPIQSISCNAHCLFVPSKNLFLKCIITAILKSTGTKNHLQKDSLRKSSEGTFNPEVAILAQKGS